MVLNLPTYGRFGNFTLAVWQLMLAKAEKLTSVRVLHLMLFGIQQIFVAIYHW